MKKFFVLLISFICVFGFVGCNDDIAVEEGVFNVHLDEESVDVGEETQSSESQKETAPMDLVTTPAPVTTPNPNYINPDGTTIETRILPPEGYTRVAEEDNSFGAFLRDFTLKPDGAKVMLYDGTEKYDQSVHVAVFDLSLENRDLQQCADSVMRMYGEYYWQSGQYDKIAFHFTNGFLAEYTKWRDGYRIEVNGNDVTWVKKKEYDDSYESFISYMQIIFSYAGTLSMEGEATPIELMDLQIGDVFLSGGSPGHVVMVVDVCENESGEKAFLLAQGYMPAQEFHVLKNPKSEHDPWYYEADVVYPFRTPQYTFYEGSLKRLSY